MNYKKSWQEFGRWLALNEGLDSDTIKDKFNEMDLDVFEIINKA